MVDNNLLYREQKSLKVKLFYVQSGKSLLQLATMTALCLVLTACAMQNPTQRIKEAARSENSIGIVVQSSGFPTVIRKNRNYMLASQSRIYQGDIVETDGDSMIKIKMNDGSTFILGHDTHFVIHYYKYESNLKSLIARISFTSGALLTSTVKDTLAHKTRFEITTPLAVIAVQSAEFWSGFTFGRNRLDTLMLSGTKVVIQNDHGSIEIKNNKSGAAVIGNSAPKAAEIWPNRKLDEALVTIIF